MADTHVTVVINAQDHASKVLQGFGGNLHQVGLTAAGVAGGMLAAGGITSAMDAVGGAIGGIIKSTMDFDKTMSGVKAVSGATGEEMSGLSALALQLGKDTVFSAAEAGQGIEELVKGGISIGDIMDGAAEATLNLATAGRVDLATSAEIASNAMAMFGIKGEGMAHVADMIAGAANASSLSVTDFKFAMSMSGAVAHLVGQDFDDLAVAIAVMGQQGLKGSDAGTSLKTMLLNLQPTTKAQVAGFQALGLATDAFVNGDGSFKHMAEIAGILQGATKNLTAAQKTQALEMIFGTDAIRAAAIMSEQGAEGFTKMAGEMGKVTAAAVAAERLNNLAGDVEQLKGSLQTAAIVIGTEFTPNLRALTQGATDATNKFLGFKEGGLDTVSAALYGMDQIIAEQFGPDAVEAFEDVTRVGGELVSQFGRIVRFIVDDFLPPIVGAIHTWWLGTTEARAGIGEAIGSFVSDVGTAVHNVGEFFNTLGSEAGVMGELVGATFDRLGTTISDAWATVETKTREAWGNVASFVSDKAKAIDDVIHLRFLGGSIWPTVRDAWGLVASSTEGTWTTAEQVVSAAVAAIDQDLVGPDGLTADARSVAAAWAALAQQMETPIVIPASNASAIWGNSIVPASNASGNWGNSIVPASNASGNWGGSAVAPIINPAQAGPNYQGPGGSWSGPGNFNPLLPGGGQLIGGVIHLASGGWVPGSLGSPVPAILHGGEYVLPAGGSGRGGGDVYVTVNVAGSVIAERDLATTVREQLLRDGLALTSIFGGRA